MQAVHPPQPSIHTMVSLPQPLCFKSSTSSAVVDHENLETAEPVENASPPVESEWPTWILPYRHTRRSILLIRALLNEHFGLPTETISIILDYADCWVSTIAELAANPRPLLGQNTIITMPPLGTHVIDPASRSKQPQVRVRGLHPCREIRIRMQVKHVREEMKSIPYTSFPCHLAGWRYMPPGDKIFIMGVLWKNEDEVEGAPKRGNRDQVFDVSHLPSVLRAEGHDWERPLNIRGRYLDKGPPDMYAWSIPVVEEPLVKDKGETMEVVWRWTDRSAGGDLIRALKAGDSPQLCTNHHVAGWGTVVHKMEVEVLYAI